MYLLVLYGSQVWCNNTHSRKIDTQLNSVMRVISETVKLRQQILNHHTYVGKMHL